MKTIVNINTAVIEELTTLPGIGPALAERILAKRPFNQVEDLRNVSGIGSALLEQLLPLVTVGEETASEEKKQVIYLDSQTETIERLDETAVEAAVSEQISPEETMPSWNEPVQEAEQAATKTAQVLDEEQWVEPQKPAEEVIDKEKAIITVKTQETAQKETTKQPRPLTMGKAFLIAAACSLATFVLAVLLTLGILGSINNGLHYASADQARAIYQQMETLNAELSKMSDDIEGLRSRLSNLESLSGRVGELELGAETLSADLSAMTAEVQGVKDQISELTDQMAEFMDSAEQFQLFINGLGDLLDTLTEAPQEVP
jgi:competence ComEA-like helix-hairpin-helix protein